MQMIQIDQRIPCSKM